MPPDSSPIGNYFDTPARAERLQLLLYLVRNAGEVIYLRAPAGAGKTLFAQRLFDNLSDRIAAVWVRGSEDCDVARAAVDQLGLPPESARHWPDAVLAGLDGQELLLIVDDADRLGLRVVEDLDLLHAHGGRLLLVGQGGLAETSGNWDLQFVDLPPFEAEQTAAFLRHQAGDQAARVTDDLAAGLHRAARGLPGPLLDALNGVLGGRGRSGGRRHAPSAKTGATRRRPMWQWLAGGVLALLLAGVFLFQDRINRVFEAGDSVVAGRPAGLASDVAPPADLAPEFDRTPAVAQLAPTESEPALSVIGPERTSATAGPSMPAASDEVPVGPVVEAEQEDPLEAVMEDALAAADAETGGPEAAAAPGAEPAAARPTEPEPAPPANGQTEEPRAADRLPGETPAPVAEQPQAPPAPEPSAAEPRPVEPVPAATGPQSGPESQPPAAEVQTAAPVGAPVESREPQRGPPVVTAKPTVVVPQTPPADSGAGWLSSRDPARYTLQLVGSRDRAAVGRFVNQHAIGQPYAIFERDLKGRPWYSLIAGDYPDRAAAIAARERLPSSLNRSGVWARTFGSIKNLK